MCERIKYLESQLEMLRSAAPPLPPLLQQTSSAELQTDVTLSHLEDMQKDLVRSQSSESLLLSSVAEMEQKCASLSASLSEAIKQAEEKDTIAAKLLEQTQAELNSTKLESMTIVKLLVNERVITFFWHIHSFI